MHHPLPVSQMDGEDNDRAGAVFRQSIQFIDSLNCNAAFEISQIHTRGMDDFHGDIGELSIKTRGGVTTPFSAAFRDCIA